MTGSDARDEYREALDAAHRHAMEWIESLDERPIRPELDVDGILERLVADPARGGPRGRRGDRRAGGCRGPWPHGDGLSALLRLRHRRRLPGGAGRRLARGRVGPEHRVTSAHPCHRGRRRGRGELAAGGPRASRRQRRRVRDRRHQCEPQRADRRARHRAARRRPRRRHGHSGSADDPVPRGRCRAHLGGARRAHRGARCAGDGGRRRAGPDRRRRGSPPRSPRTTAPRSSRCRPATCTPARSTTSRRRSTSPTCTAPGCTSTVRSGCGRRHPRACDTCSRAPNARTRGRPTRTRPSTCPTTAVSRSCGTRRR